MVHLRHKDDLPGGSHHGQQGSAELDFRAGAWAETKLGLDATSGGGGESAEVIYSGFDATSRTERPSRGDWRDQELQTIKRMLSH